MTFIELERLKARAPDNSNGPVFGISDNVQTKPRDCAKEGRIEDVRFHDLLCLCVLRLYTLLSCRMDLLCNRFLSAKDILCFELEILLWSASFIPRDLAPQG